MPSIIRRPPREKQAFKLTLVLNNRALLFAKKKKFDSYFDLMYTPFLIQNHMPKENYANN
jgi:hypothetical protein